MTNTIEILSLGEFADGPYRDARGGDDAPLSQASGWDLITAAARDGYFCYLGETEVSDEDALDWLGGRYLDALPTGPLTLRQPLR